MKIDSGPTFPLLPLLVSLAAHADADYIIITGNEFVPGSMITDVGVAHRIPVVFLWATLDRYERDLFAERNVERYIVVNEFLGKMEK